MMSAGYFITGTDTGIGKTVSSAALLLALLKRGVRATYFKPVQTGCEERSAPDLAFVEAATGLALPIEAHCAYPLTFPSSPHLAAAQADSQIEIDRIAEQYKRLASAYETVIVEGAGGVAVPLNERDTMLDLIKALDIPVIVVCRAGLGTLNHSLLTWEALRAAGITCAGWIMTQTEASATWATIEENNRETLQKRTGVPVLGVMPFDPALARGETNRSYLDRAANELGTALWP